ncbi:CD48 antigen [Oryctolagus cuniculus]|nr:CD48 antigen [Oryctolagus cuniculus]
MCSRGWEWWLALELLLLPLVLLETSVQDHLVHRLMAVSGSNVSLQIPENLSEKYKQLTWFNTTKQKILEWEWESDKTKYFRSKFETRITFDPQSGALNISDVRKEDSSDYLVRVLMASGTEREWKIPLEVFDPVPKPVIEAKQIKKVDNTCYLTLSCTVPDQSVNYEWYGDSGPLPQEFQRSVLNITLNPQNFSKSFTCQVSNHVSSENATVYFTSSCVLARSFGVTRMASWLVVTAPLVLGFLLT